MDLLTILLSFAAITTCLMLYWAGVKALNNRAISVYGYHPINIKTGLVSMAAYVIAISGIFMGGDNAQIGLIISLLIFVFLLIRVALKTSFITMLLALPLLAIGGLGLLLVVALIYLVFAQNKENKSQQTS